MGVASTKRLACCPSGRKGAVPSFDHMNCRRKSGDVPTCPTAVVISPMTGKSDHGIVRGTVSGISRVGPSGSKRQKAILLGHNLCGVSRDVRVAANNIILRKRKRGIGRAHLLTAKGGQCSLVGISNAKETGRIPNAQIGVASAFIPINARSFQISSNGKFHPKSHVVLCHPNASR